MNSTICQTPPSQTLLSAELRSIINERNILTTKTRMKVLTALDGISRDSQRLHQHEKEKELRSNAIQEILTSEASYLHQLELVMEFFMVPLKSKDFCTQSEWNALFGNIDTLYSVNGALLEELKANPENVAGAFLKLAPYFKLYSVYAYDYKQIVSFLQEVHRNNPRLAAFIVSHETRPEVSSKLAALLIAPIQRIPRYRLLLREVLNHTTPFQQDFYTLQNALHEVERTAEHINGLVQEQENMEKMIQLQRSLQYARPGIITPGRKFIKEGILMKVSSDGRRPLPRYFILFSDMLIYCTVRPGKTPTQNGALRCCCILPLKRCSVQPVLSQGVLRLSCHGETLILFSACVEDTRRWLQALQDAVKQYHANYQTLRKDSSSRRPMRHKDVMKMAPDTLAQNINTTHRKRKQSSLQEENVDSPGTPITSSTPAPPYTPDTPDQHTSAARGCFQDCRPSKMRKTRQNVHQASRVRPPTSSSRPLRSSLRPQNSAATKRGQHITIVTPRGTVTTRASRETENRDPSEMKDPMSTPTLSSKSLEMMEHSTPHHEHNEQSETEICQKPVNPEVSENENNSVVATWSPLSSFQTIGNIVMGIHKTLRRSLRRSLFHFKPEIRLQ